MKIGLVVEHFEPHRGGLEQWSWQFAQALSARGHQVHIVSASFCPEARRMPLCCHLVGQGGRLGFAQAAEALLRQLDLDIIHDTGGGWYCDIFQPHWGSWRALVEQKLLLLPRWVRPWKRLLIRYLPRYREICRLTDRQYRNDGRLFLALSTRAAQDFQHFHGIYPEHIRIVHNGVDIRRFCPENRQKYRTKIRQQVRLDENTLLVLIVAHNFRLKGVPTLIEAVRRLRAEQFPVSLLIVGGKKHSSTRQLPGPDEPIRFVGPVEDTVPYYAAADLYVHPTLYDTFSLVVLEAMASGLPVVTSRFNGVQELLHSGQEGIVLHDPLDPDEVAQSIRRLADPQLRAQMGQAARRLAEQHPFEKNLEQILQVYQEALERNLRGQRWARPAPPFVCRRTCPEGFSENPSRPIFAVRESQDGYRIGD